MNILRIATLDYTGSRPSRADDLAEERIFSHLWKEYNGQASFLEKNTAMSEIAKLSEHEDIVQRDAYVATSIVQFLGTKGGVVYLEEANRQTDRSASREEAYLFVWQSKMNVRRPGVNHGYSGLEHILNSKPSPPLDRLPHDTGLVDPISLRDVKIAEGTIRWLASPNGQEFIAEAERRIKVQRERNRLLFNALHNSL